MCRTLLLLLGLAVVQANHWIRIRVWEFNPPLGIYHSEIDANGNTGFIAFGPSGVVSYDVKGRVVKEWTIPTPYAYTPEGGHQFWTKVNDLRDDWHKRKYNLFSQNCNHFADAILKAFGSNLPGQYFSRGDHLDKQLYHHIVQSGLYGIKLSPEQAEQVGKVWNDGKTAVNQAVEAVRNVLPHF